MRDARGRLLPGYSLNPKGRQKGSKNVGEHVRSRSRGGKKLIKVLEEVAYDPQADRSERIAAAKALLDRGFGKPEATHNINADVTAHRGEQEPTDFKAELDLYCTAEEAREILRLQLDICRLFHEARARFEDAQKRGVTVEQAAGEQPLFPGPRTPGRFLLPGQTKELQ